MSIFGFLVVLGLVWYFLLGGNKEVEDSDYAADGYAMPVEQPDAYESSSGGAVAKTEVASADAGALQMTTVPSATDSSRV